MQGDLDVRVPRLRDRGESGVQLVRRCRRCADAPGERAEIGRRDLDDRRQRESIAGGLHAVEPGGDDRIGVGEAEELEVACLQATGPQVVRAVPVEDALRAPGVRDAEVPRIRERAQPFHRARVDHARPRQHDDPAVDSVDLVDVDRTCARHAGMVARRAGSRREPFCEPLACRP